MAGNASEKCIKKGVRTLLDFRVDVIAVLSFQVWEKSVVFLGSLLLFFELVNANAVGSKRCV
jgi:hypothetical protein